MPDYSLLQNASIPHPIAIGQRPVYLPPNALNTLAQGFQQGRVQNAGIANQQTQNSLLQQQIALQQQMAPADIALKNAQAQQAQMQMAQYQKQMMIMNQLAQAGQGGQSPPQGQPMPVQGPPQSGLASMAPMQVTPQMQGPTSPEQAPQQGLPPVQQPRLTIGQQGSTQQYFNDAANIYKRMGQPAMVKTMTDAAQSLADATIKNKKDAQEMTDTELKTKYGQLQNAGSIAVRLTNMKDQDAVDEYNSTQGKLIQNIDPNAPEVGADPKKILGYIHGAVGAYMHVNEAIKSSPALASIVFPKDQQAGIIKTATTKSTDTATQNSQDLVAQRAQEYQDAVKKFGENSNEAKQAKFAVTTAQNDLIKTTTPTLGQSLTAPSAPGVPSGVVTPSAKGRSNSASGKVWTYNPTTGKLE